jgi:hypothetical protein
LSHQAVQSPPPDALNDGLQCAGNYVAARGVVCV